MDLCSLAHAALVSDPANFFFYSISPFLSRQTGALLWRATRKRFSIVLPRRMPRTMEIAKHTNFVFFQERRQHIYVSLWCYRWCTTCPSLITGERGRLGEKERENEKEREMMMSFICSARNKIGAELYIYLEEGTYHTRLFRGPSTNDMKK
jgi:hypothetical protein